MQYWQEYKLLQPTIQEYKDTQKTKIKISYGLFVPFLDINPQITRALIFIIPRVWGVTSNCTKGHFWQCLRAIVDPGSELQLVVCKENYIGIISSTPKTLVLVISISHRVFIGCCLVWFLGHTWWCSGIFWFYVQGSLQVDPGVIICYLGSNPGRQFARQSPQPLYSPRLYTSISIEALFTLSTIAKDYYFKDKEQVLERKSFVYYWRECKLIQTIIQEYKEYNN